MSRRCARAFALAAKSTCTWVTLCLPCHIELAAIQVTSGCQVLLGKITFSAAVAYNWIQ
jgi:molybdenum cofactor biosynthesis enzyme